MWRDLVGSYPEVVRLTHHFKFPRSETAETPVADARGIVRIINKVHCRCGLPEVLQVVEDFKFLQARRPEVVSLGCNFAEDFKFPFDYALAYALAYALTYA